MSFAVHPAHDRIAGQDAEAHPLRLLHTSDVHLGAYTSEPYKDGELEPALRAFQHVLDLAAEHGAEVGVIAGDFFDHVRVKRPYVDVTGQLMEAFNRPIVVLPGNHDPAMPEGIYAKHGAAFPPNVHVICSAEGELVVLDEPGVQFWGQAHESYDDFSPAAACPAWRHWPDRHMWRIAVAHGYYVGDGEARYSYLIRDAHLDALDADYIALGHIDVHQQVGGGTPAYYPGAPRHSGGATIVDLGPEGVAVRHMPHAGHGEVMAQHRAPMFGGRSTGP